MRIKTSKIILAFIFCVTLGVLFSVNVPGVKAATIEQMKAQIASLQAQINSLLQQLVELQGEQWCHDFNVNLRYGDRGDGVSALQTALGFEGFSGLTSNIRGIFEQYTASAVTGFQEKHALDILAPWGLAHGTGYVGTTTRAKLNALYGCDEQERSIAVLSPNGGEEWMVGQTYDITWEYNEPISSHVNIILVQSSAMGSYQVLSIASGVDTDKQEYSWIVELPDGYPEDQWRVKIYESEVLHPSLAVSDESDNNFSIVESSSSCHTSPLWSWDYCSSDCRCSAGQGDCDTDYDCHVGNYCAGNVGANYGQVSSMDVCEAEEEVEIPSITVISPNGGEEWIVGQTYNVTWSYSGMTDCSVSINLIDSRTNTAYGSNPAPISASLGKYSFTVLDNIPVGTNVFKIEVVGGKGCPTDQSNNYFSIVETEEPSITVVSPNGGEEWVVGQTYDITWEYNEPISPHVNIILVQSNAMGSYQVLSIASGVDTDKQEYGWIVELPDGYPEDQWRVKIYESEVLHPSLAISDESDNNFSIVESGE